MKEQDKLRVETQTDRLGVVKILAEKEKVVRDLKDMVRKLEDRKVDETSLAEKQKQIDSQKKRIRELEDDIIEKKKELKAWSQHCILFWNKDPSSIFKSKTKNTR